MKVTTILTIKWLIVFSSVTLFAQAQPSDRCENWTAKIISIEGKAQWRAQGKSQWQAATTDLSLCIGDTLRIQDSRATLRLPNDTVVRLKEKNHT